MFAVKVLLGKNKRDAEFSKDLAKIVSFIKNNLKKELSIINDSSCIEIVSGTSEKQEGEILVELLVKKTISINKKTFREELEGEIKSFYKDKF